MLTSILSRWQFYPAVRACVPRSFVELTWLLAGTKLQHKQIRVSDGACLLEEIWGPSYWSIPFAQPNPRRNTRGCSLSTNHSTLTCMMSNHMHYQLRAKSVEIAVGFPAPHSGDMCFCKVRVVIGCHSRIGFPDIDYIPIS